MISPFRRFSARPDAVGLYDPPTSTTPAASRSSPTCAASPATTSSSRRSPRCATSTTAAPSGAEPDTGDGAGILTQVPDAFLREVVDFDAAAAGARTPSASRSCPTTSRRPPRRRPRSRRSPPRRACRPRLARRAGRPRPARRDRPRLMPRSRQLFVAADRRAAASSAWRSSGWRSACASAPSARPAVYFPSLSARTLVYKGMLTTDQLEPFFPDLSDERFATALALVHSRFSTNTFPSWPLAHPFRLIAHNGEINTVQGQPQLDAGPRGAARVSDLIPGDLRAAVPDLHARTRATRRRFDEVLELLHLGGRSLPHAVLMMIPEAWENHAEMDPARRAFYEFHSIADGAVGRPGLRRLHRRHPHRRGARPQRPAPGPLLGHRRRPRRPGQRGRRARPRPGQGRRARAGCSRAGCSSSTPTHGRIVDDDEIKARARRPSTRTTSGCTPA